MYHAETDYEVYCRKIDGRDTWWRAGDGCRLTGPTDTSAGILFQYDRRCGLCWLGYGHSGDYHHAQIEAVVNGWHPEA